MDKKKQKNINDTTKKLLDVLSVDADFEIVAQEEGAEIILTTPDSRMLIGYHGETLEALQLILSLCIAKALGKFVRISIEIGDYKKNRTERLEQLVQQTKEQVLADQQERTLPSLKAWERRVVHLMLPDDQQVTSESMGEGRDAALDMKPRI